MTLYVIGMIAIIVIVLIMSLVVLKKAYAYQHEVDPAPMDDEHQDSQQQL